MTIVLIAASGCRTYDRTVGGGTIEGPPTSVATSVGSVPGTTAVAPGSIPPTTVVIGERPAEVADLEVVLSGFAVLGTGPQTRATYGIIYKNPNEHWIARDVSVTVRFTNGFGVEVASHTFTAPAIPPSTESAAAQAMPGEGAVKMEAAFRTGTWERTDRRWAPFEITPATVDHESSVNGARFVAQVRSPSPAALPKVTVVAIAVSGLAVAGGDSVELASLPPGGPTEVAVLTRAKFPTSVNAGRIFVVPSTLPEPAP